MLLLRLGLCSVSSGIGGGAKGKLDGMPGGVRSSIVSLFLVLSLPLVLPLLVVGFLVAGGDLARDSGICARVALDCCGTMADLGVCGSTLGEVGVSW